MKDFEDHRRDVQNEFRRGDHKIKWIPNDENLQKKYTWQDGIIDNYNFVIWTNGDCYIEFYHLSAKGPKYYGASIKGVPSTLLDKIFGRKDTDFKEDKDWCQNWYLNWLAKERTKK